jgi:hypothetical protein
LNKLWDGKRSRVRNGGRGRKGIRSKSRMLLWSSRFRVENSTLNFICRLPFKSAPSQLISFEIVATAAASSSLEVKDTRGDVWYSGAASPVSLMMAWYFPWFLTFLLYLFAIWRTKVVVVIFEEVTDGVARHKALVCMGSMRFCVSFAVKFGVHSE